MSENSSELLRETLRAWAAEEELKAGGPPKLEDSLMRAFDGHHRLRRQRRMWQYAGAIAAAIILVLLVARPAHRAPVLPAVARDTKPPVVDPPEDSQIVAPVVASSRPASHRRVRRPRPVVQQTFAAARPPAEQRTETMTDFYPLNALAAAEPFVSSGVIRVELPRTALAAYGLPMDQNRLPQRVKADLLLGEDGMARAVRFVQ